MKLTVIVNQEHIIKGEKATCDKCPIALALNEQHPREIMWCVDPDSASNGSFENEERYLLPAKARDFMTRFDDGEEVKPFSFKLINIEPQKEY